MRTWILLLALIAGPAPAQVVTTCIGKDGNVTFTSQPCKPGERVAGTVDAAPERMTPARLHAAERRRRQAAESANLDRLSATPWRPPRSSRRAPPATDRHARCQAARAHRDAVLQRVGLKRTHDLLRSLDAKVYDACK